MEVLDRPRSTCSVRRTVLFLNHASALGGGEIALFNLVTNLDPCRYEPVVALGADGPLRTRLCQAGIETHVLPLAPEVMHTRKDSLMGRGLFRPGALAYSSAYVRRIARFIRERHVALVHTNSLKADILGGLAAKLARVPVVWHVRDRIAEDYLPVQTAHAFRALCRLIPDGVVANSSATLGTLRLRKRAPAVVAHDGIAVWPVHENARPSGSEPGSGPVIGLIGRISPWKGQHIVIEAAPLVLRRFPDARFLIVGAPLFGEEAYEARVRARVAALGIQNHVEFTGFREDVDAVLSEIDIVAHASTIGEPFGQVVLEAMAAGKAVVATNGGGIPEIIVHGETGILVPMGDANAMADAMALLLANPDRAGAMGRAGRARAVSQFSIQNTIRRVVSLHDAVLD